MEMRLMTQLHFSFQASETQNCQAPKRTYCKSGSVKLINAIIWFTASLLKQHGHFRIMSMSNTKTRPTCSEKNFEVLVPYLPLTGLFLTGPFTPRSINIKKYDYISAKILSEV